MLIKEIPYEQTWPLRHQVMWPEKPLEYIQLAQDPEGIHYGLFVDEQLTSVVSLFIRDRTAQFRKFATAQAAQGKGYGSHLLRHMMQEVEILGLEKIWCNARVEKAAFYQKFGLLPTDQTFSRGDKKYVIMEKCLDAS